MLEIGTLKLDSILIAAPLAGISNPVYRRMCRQYGAAMAVSEMISDKALHFKNRKTQDMCRIAEGEHPVSLQLFGSDPETMAEAAEYLCANTDCDAVDINMGCPVPKVIKAHAGSWLMQEPQLAYDIMKAVVSHSDRPVTVKIRAGWDHSHINCDEIAALAEKAGISAVAVHGRTRGQMYAGHSDNRYIQMVKQAVSIPVIGNGDIRTVQDAFRMIEETGCDGLMIGRGLLGRPYFLRELQAALRGEPFEPVSYEERVRLLREYAEQLCAYEGEKNGIRMMRGMAPWYIAGMPHAAKVKVQLNAIDSLEDLYHLTDRYLELLCELRKEEEIR